jgi:lipopolysaccharide/colanic/teichoic acid biosynthesis glycosyltransferase
MSKRPFDFFISFVVLLLFLPLGVVIAAILHFTGEGEVFYCQDRIGRYRHLFKIYKFATMLKNSPNLGAGDITVADDPRVLPLGRFLRQTKLNEVPQILNILFGTMTIVGPRPLTPKNFLYYSSESQGIISQMKPGLTGIGSIVFRDEERILRASGKPFEQCYREEIAPYKAQLERWYFFHRGLRTDILIVLITAWVILRPNSSVYRRVWKDLPAVPLSSHS